MYQSARFSITLPSFFKSQSLAWAQSFDTCCYLDNNEYTNYPYQQYEALIAAGTYDAITAPTGEAFHALEQFYQQYQSWLFGFLTYDLKNEVEDLNSNNFDGIQMPDLHFFVPQYIIQIISKTEVHVLSIDSNPTKIFQAIQQTTPPDISNKPLLDQPLQQRLSKQEYLDTIKAIREHIAAGDVYELNFCQEFFLESVKIDPLTVFKTMNADSPTPFSAFYQYDEKYLLCTSPERFLKKSGKKLISQPIKGTIKRGDTPTEDQQLQEQLQQSEKDRAENVMIVDLVRNDLSKYAHPGTVTVEDLFGIYTFPKVHHMISTITAQLEGEPSLNDIFTATFPMGSMTGAPKYTAMQLIERYEKTKRGLYAGAVGYITPEGDFDFNVVIRSLLYSAQRRYLSYQAGGAIVFDSEPEAEYEESLLKAEGMFRLLASPTPS